jgi:hypothetical protein
MHLLPLDYMFMVMVFLFSTLEGLIHIHNWVENRLEVHLMEDCQEEDHLIETHLKDRHLIYMLDFMDRKHLIQGYSCNHGINQF